MSETTTAQISGIDLSLPPWAGPLISADSHVIEPTSVWKKLLAPGFWPNEGKMFQERAGGTDPVERLKEMQVDGVQAEVLYPSLGLKVFSIPDVILHENCCRAYNDWLIEYCSHDPSRLVGIAMIPTFDISRAVAELERCADAGLRGILVWQTPHPDLPFTSDHYEDLWAAAAARRLPVSMHILTGFNYSRTVLGDTPADPVDLYRGSVNDKLLVVMNALFDLIVGGALERHPDMRLVLVENEVSWLPFVLDQWDYYYRRISAQSPLPLAEAPTAYFERQVFVTFFRDALAGRLFDWWGASNCMWSNDYPHGNSTWPHSRQYVTGQLGSLRSDVQERLTHENVEKLYGLETAGSLAAGSGGGT